MTIETSREHCRKPAVKEPTRPDGAETLNSPANPIRRGNAAKRSQLYARLGLTAQASDKDIEAAHDELVQFLEGAPSSLSSWAKREIAAVDEAHERLLEPEPEKTPISPGTKRLGVVAAGLVVAVLLGVGVYNMGGDSNSSKGESDQSVDAITRDLTPAEKSKVDELMQKVDADPKDAASFIKLGDIFFKVGDYNAAGGWMAQAVKADPKNTKALLALGAARFNLGDVADARRQWLKVIAVDPKNVEAYYDLGFLYLSQKPPDMESVRKSWGKVVELDPDSSVAKTVKTHLKQISKSPSESDSASSSGSADSSSAPQISGGE